MSKITIEQIATDYKLWMEYVDPDGVDSEQKFNSMSFGEKLDIIKICFGIETE